MAEILETRPEHLIWCHRVFANTLPAHLQEIGFVSLHLLQYRPCWLVKKVTYLLKCTGFEEKNFEFVQVHNETMN